MKYHSQMKYTSLPAPSVIEFTFSYTSVSLTYVFFFKRHPSISKRVTKTFIKIISLYAYNFFDGFCATTMGKTWDSVEQPRHIDTVTDRELWLGENIFLKIVEILVFSWDYRVKTLSFSYSWYLMRNLAYYYDSKVSCLV